MLAIIGPRASISFGGASPSGAAPRPRAGQHLRHRRPRLRVRRHRLEQVAPQRQVVRRHQDLQVLAPASPPARAGRTCPASGRSARCSGAAPAPPAASTAATSCAPPRPAAAAASTSAAPGAAARSRTRPPAAAPAPPREIRPVPGERIEDRRRHMAVALVAAHAVVGEAEPLRDLRAVDAAGELDVDRARARDGRRSCTAAPLARARPALPTPPTRTVRKSSRQGLDCASTHSGHRHLHQDCIATGARPVAHKTYARQGRGAILGRRGPASRPRRPRRQPRARALPPAKRASQRTPGGHGLAGRRRWPAAVQDSQPSGPLTDISGTTRAIAAAANPSQRTGRRAQVSVPKLRRRRMRGSIV